MGEYRLSPRAERDLEEIWLYTEGRWSAAQADRYTAALIDTIEELAANPTKGRPADNIRPGYRKQSAGAHFIFYRQVPPDQVPPGQVPGIEVIRILHQSMDVPTRLSEPD
jgi:toxin ParE1/3/4